MILDWTPAAQLPGPGDFEAGGSARSQENLQEAGHLVGSSAWPSRGSTAGGLTPQLGRGQEVILQLNATGNFPTLGGVGRRAVLGTRCLPTFQEVDRGDGEENEELEEEKEEDLEEEEEEKEDLEEEEEE